MKLKWIFFIKFIFFLACGITSFEPNLRIVGGSPAIPNSWPAQIYLFFNYAGTYTIQGVSTLLTVQNSCGGTIISSNAVITAAHCIITSFKYRINNKIYKLKINFNTQFPTFASMLKVYAGVNNSKEKIEYFPV